jgi:hypothetical protein
MAAFLSGVRDNGEYNFMTQDQMAKSFIDTIYSKAYISKNNNELSIKENLQYVPNQSGEYKGTLGIKLEKGEKYKDVIISVSSPIHFEKDGDLYFGLLGSAKIKFNESSNKDFYIVRSNTPIKITSFGDRATNINFLSDGMQQIKIYSVRAISIDGARIKIQKKGNYYTVTHYGKAITIRILK